MLPRLDRPSRVSPSSVEPRGIAILGSTGSIGTQTLEIARLFPDRLRVKALTGGSNWELLAEQARIFRPETVAVCDVALHARLRDALSGLDIRVLAGEDSLDEVAQMPGVDTVVAAVVGFAGLRPTLAAVRAGREVALANKESLVIAGELVRHLAAEASTTVIPIDSEHSAIFQCLVGEDLADIESITLTASGGPFLHRPLGTFEAITRVEALRHPNWEMGAKITVDSATMMNKGLEVIEACWLFGLRPDQVGVMIHPQSIIHSLVSFVDGSMKAQLGVPDMRLPIQYALSFPGRWSAPHPRIDWTQLPQLDFSEPDSVRFPCLALAYEALKAGGAAPAVLNAANEEAVALFLQDEARFTDIPRLVEAALAEVPQIDPLDLDDLEATDRNTRRRVHELHTSLTI
jgi:1-deoxy-D-xylulose-5-phosphate reductoisomerase